MKKKVFLCLFAAIIISLCSCGLKIVNYNEGYCVKDPADNKCKKVCGWERTSHMDEDLCIRAKYHCSKGEYHYGDFTGCGCARPVFCK